MALDAATKALHLRRSAGVRLQDAVCVYDVAQHLDIEVRFEAIASMEGMYRRGSNPLIIVSSLRPHGRQAFTCAHELGHHAFGHGSRIDDLIEEIRTTPHKSLEEYLADTFAGFFLMPKLAVSRAFACRGWQPESCTALQAYTVAGWLGVGYTTLLHHMCHSLHLISRHHADELIKISLKKIRSAICPDVPTDHLLVVDAHWDARAVDVQVGDLMLLPVGSISEARNAELVVEDSRGALFRAAAPGIGRFLSPVLHWASFVRVSKSGFTGRNVYRHLEDLDEEDDELALSE
jgi:hypothetical protein